MKKRGIYSLKIFLKILVVCGIAFIITWEAREYYGRRRYGQQLFQREHYARYTSLFSWEMNLQGDILPNANDIGNVNFENGVLAFITGKDPYFYLNLKGEKLDPKRFYILSLRMYSEQPGEMQIFFWCDTPDSGKEGAFSAPLKVESGWKEYSIDLWETDFYTLPEPDRHKNQWGGTVGFIKTLRFDPPEGKSGNQVKIDWIRFHKGVTLTHPMPYYQTLGVINGLEYHPPSQSLRIKPGVKKGEFISHPIGVGTIRAFWDISWTGEEGVYVQTRTGNTHDTDGPSWTPWSSPSGSWRSSSIDSPPDKYLQYKVVLHQTEQEADPRLQWVRIRYLDPSPPGDNSLLWGTNLLPTVSRPEEVEGRVADLTNSPWVRVPMEGERVYHTVNRLVAEDINVVGSWDLSSSSRSTILSAIRLYHQQVKCWEFCQGEQQTPSALVQLFRDVNRIDSFSLIIPSRIDRDYFAQVGLDALVDFVRERPPSEINLDRGPGWYVVMALVFFLLIIGLRREIGYNFHFGYQELSLAGITLAVLLGLSLPLMYLWGMGTLKFPTWGELSAALSRYPASAIIQEFGRALLIVITYRLLGKVMSPTRWRWVITLIATSLIFALGHLGYPGLSPSEVSGFISLTFIAGLLLGWIYIKRQSLAATFVVHLLANITLFTCTTFQA
ncbi:MAG: CPBP family intramembrane metalloprotease [Candidatus Aminicenantes bacterium]|nr:CPBP family intramembrane metalloprotease [Candidatus Aminicenantes bacterium]